MAEWKTPADVIAFAIAAEERAHRFYTELAATARNAAIGRLFLAYAREELGHRRRLEGIDLAGWTPKARRAVGDLKMTDYLVDVEPGPNLEYEDALILAMRREKAAFKLYTDLAEASDDPALRALFASLAQEEAKHKLRFEVEYDDWVYQEN